MIESSITIHNHIDSIAHIDDWEFNWSVYEWEKAIPDFEWSKGHSGTLLSDAKARKLEEIFAQYLLSVKDKVDGENLCILDDPT